jgi:hypothetical protein
MLAGALIGLAIISLFVFTVDKPNPEWGNLWIIKPLIITPLAGAFGILSFYLKNIIKPSNKFTYTFIILLSFIAFLIALWMGIVLGLDGTLWN